MPCARGAKRHQDGLAKVFVLYSASVRVALDNHCSCCCTMARASGCGVNALGRGHHCDEQRSYMERSHPGSAGSRWCNRFASFAARVVGAVELIRYVSNNDASQIRCCW